MRGNKRCCWHGGVGEVERGCGFLHNLPARIWSRTESPSGTKDESGQSMW